MKKSYTLIKAWLIIFELLLIASTAILISCDISTDNSAKKNDQLQPSAPYDRKIGNGMMTYYIFHNFIGNEPDIIPSTAAADTERYLERGIAYLQMQYNNFYDSLADRPKLQRYFAQVTFSPELKINHHHKREITVSEKIDYYINQISTSCELVMKDLTNNLTDPQEREAFILCYRVLSNEAYKEGMGKARDSNNKMMEKYNQERTAISGLWNKNEFLKSVNLDYDLTSRNCINTTSKLYTLLHNTALNMQKKSITEDIKMKDLQNFLNLALNESSLKAMHDFTAEYLNHTGEDCSISSWIIKNN